MSMSAGLPALTPAYIAIMLLMTVRISAMLLSTPILGSRTVPPMSKIGLSLLLAFILLATTAPKAVPPPTFGHLMIAIGKEVLIGMMAGFAVTLVYAALQLVASLAGVQIGFGFSNTVDLNFGGQTPVLDQLFTGMGTLVFLTGNFHHQFLIGIQALFDIMPPNAFSILGTSAGGLVALSANMFLVAMQVVLPLVGALLLADLALGIMARTAPQMNIFFVGMPIKIAVGIFAIIVMLPFVLNLMERFFGRVANDMILILR